MNKSSIVKQYVNKVKVGIKDGPEEKKGYLFHLENELRVFADENNVDSYEKK